MAEVWYNELGSCFFMAREPINFFSNKLKTIFFFTFEQTIIRLPEAIFHKMLLNTFIYLFIFINDQVHVPFV